MVRASLPLLFPFFLPLAAAQLYGGGGGDGGGGGAATTTKMTAATTTKSSPSSSSTHSVDVGKDGLSFTPDTLAVSLGDQVEFHFFPGDHSVVEAAFDNPCHPMSSTSFYSGFFPGNTESSNVFVLTVNNTKPIWFYCAQVGHCQAGMVGVINPPKSGPDTLNAFKKAASSAKDSTEPAKVQGGLIRAGTEDGKSMNSVTRSNDEAPGVRPWADLSVMFVLTSVAAMFMT